MHAKHADDAVRLKDHRARVGSPGAACQNEAAGRVQTRITPLISRFAKYSPTRMYLACAFVFLHLRRNSCFAMLPPSRLETVCSARCNRSKIPLQRP
jgi:hypothetical protein